MAALDVVAVGALAILAGAFLRVGGDEKAETTAPRERDGGDEGDPLARLYRRTGVERVRCPHCGVVNDASYEYCRDCLGALDE